MGFARRRWAVTFLAVVAVFALEYFSIQSDVQSADGATGGSVALPESALVAVQLPAVA